MNLFKFGPTVEITYKIDDFEKRPAVKMRKGGELFPLFKNGDTIQGSVNIKIVKGGKLEHLGVRLELIGQIELLYEKNHPHRFHYVKEEFEPAGILAKDKTYTFQFPNVDMRNETYRGRICRLRYFLRTSIIKNYSSNIVEEYDLCVHNKQLEPTNLKPIKMEVGIEDCLHIEFYYQKTYFNLNDIIYGKIYFLLVRIKIKFMEISLIRRESSGPVSNRYHDSQVLTKYEIMDGAPVEDECVPVRMALGGYDLTPTMLDVHNKFSVKYLLNLVLVDIDNRRYFKQSEIVLYRSSIPTTDRASSKYIDKTSLVFQAKEMLAPPKATARVKSTQTSAVKSPKSTSRNSKS